MATSVSTNEAPTPKRKSRKPATKKAAKKANGNGTHKAKAAKAKASGTPRTRDPAKLDAYGFRKESMKSLAASMYARKRGATLSEVKEATGSVQFNAITQLEERGFKFKRTQEDGAGKRPATRYHLLAK